ncbi:unnamed protein product [Vitrella brassicaformis CCMP3155]|uniref:Uncharacterized protein n=4 Tax=Vitrella brassicaformis TaxID=1169539 RepID=A0A0G4FEG3_VITBC|nr:unnamed protein product [Vitrella brassicaformis CCMP3155]|eukprot:CEM11608.1 unnamed protein product [Vitrella brassicaformis CCMP3155]
MSVRSAEKRHCDLRPIDLSPPLDPPVTAKRVPARVAGHIAPSGRVRNSPSPPVSHAHRHHLPPINREPHKDGSPIVSRWGSTNGGGKGVFGLNGPLAPSPSLLRAVPSGKHTLLETLQPRPHHHNHGFPAHVPQPAKEERAAAGVEAEKETLKGASEAWNFMTACLAESGYYEPMEEPTVRRSPKRPYRKLPTPDHSPTESPEVAPRKQYSDGPNGLQLNGSPLEALRGIPSETRLRRSSSRSRAQPRQWSVLTKATHIVLPDVKAPPTPRRSRRRHLSVRKPSQPPTFVPRDALTQAAIMDALSSDSDSPACYGFPKRQRQKNRRHRKRPDRLRESPHGQELTGDEGTWCEDPFGEEDTPPHRQGGRKAPWTFMPLKRERSVDLPDVSRLAPHGLSSSSLSSAEDLLMINDAEDSPKAITGKLRHRNVHEKKMRRLIREIEDARHNTPGLSLPSHSTAPPSPIKTRLMRHVTLFVFDDVRDMADRNKKAKYLPPLEREREREREKEKGKEMSGDKQPVKRSGSLGGGYTSAVKVKQGIRRTGSLVDMTANRRAASKTRNARPNLISALLGPSDTPLAQSPVAKPPAIASHILSPPISPANRLLPTPPSPHLPPAPHSAPADTANYVSPFFPGQPTLRLLKAGRTNGMRRSHTVPALSGVCKSSRPSTAKLLMSLKSLNLDKSGSPQKGKRKGHHPPSPRVNTDTKDTWYPSPDWRSVLEVKSALSPDDASQWHPA